jgi:pimeloyl-ACP methyl ester carboxylesterase
MPKRLCDPVIVVPGIIASYLRDDYPLPPEDIWTVLTKDFDRTQLHPDDVRYEAQEPAQVRPGQVYEIAYKELVEELRHNLREKRDRPVPVHAFAYDWRQPLAVTEVLLGAFIDEVIARARLLAHYHRAGYGEVAPPTVNLVGHSMGGLIIAGYLEACAAEGTETKVAKVATLATPFQGSYEAIIKVATGTANLGTAAPSSREREAARVTPALYHLLPSFDGAVTTEDEQPLSIFEPANWQPSVVDSIAEYVRLHSVEPGNAPAQRQKAQELFAEMLDGARTHRQRIDGFTLEGAGLEATDWLCIIGVNVETRVHLRVGERRGKPVFVLRGDRADGWISGEDAEARRRTGDGTVSFEGAQPQFLNLGNLVCLTPDDFGYWEVQDRLMAEAAGFHGILPNMNLVHRLIVRHFTGRPDRHENTWGWRAPGAETWDPPFKIPREKKLD